MKQKFTYELEVKFNKEFRYHTKIYQDIMEEILPKKIEQKYYKDALNWFFYRDRKVPLYEKHSIQRIEVYEEDRILTIYAKKQTEMFKNVKYLAYKTGWYFYITGAPLKKDIVSKIIDDIPNHKKKISFTWSISKNITMDLIPIESRINRNSYLLKIQDQDSTQEITILLDAGLDKDGIRILRSQVKTLNLIFISHAHYDHTCGLMDLINDFKTTPIISSRTTFEFFILYNWHVGSLFKNNQDLIKEIILRYYFIKNLDIIEINKDFRLKFFYAGHMPGALMFYIELGGYKFLYTGDFTYYDYFPIAGVKTQQKLLPRKIDFCLVEGTSSSQQYDAPSHIFSVLKDKITERIRHYNRILILADYGSTAMVYFFTLFYHFRKSQKQNGLEALRPNIYMTENLKRFFQILTFNNESIHPYLQKNIGLDYNPFQSAIIKWLEGYRDLKRAIEKGGIFILHDANLKNKLAQKAVELISKYKNNVILLCGPLRERPSIELASGNDRITLDSNIINNKSFIWNRLYPSLLLNLHADEIQLYKLLQKINPEKICFFHQNPSKLTEVRMNLKRNFKELESMAIYPYSEDQIQLISEK